MGRNRYGMLCVFLIITSIHLNAQSVGISQSEFDSHYRPQKTIMWCWASSAEMVLSYEGISLPQDMIVQRIKGYNVIAGGNPYEMINSTNAILTDMQGNKVVVSGQFVMGAPSPTVLFNQLKHKRPVILTYSTGPWSGHAVVLTGIDYNINQNGFLNISKFYLFDPFSYVQSFDAFGNPFFQPNPALRYKVYDLQLSPMGLQMKDGYSIIGTVTGMILIDASHL